MHRLRRGPSLTPATLYLDFGAIDRGGPVLRKRFEAMCRLAKTLTVAVLTIPAAPLGSPFDDEVKRLATLAGFAMREGLVLAVETHSNTLSRRPGRRHRCIVQGRPRPGADPRPQPLRPGGHKVADGLDALYPLRPEHPPPRHRQGPGKFQVRVGQGEIEYDQVVNPTARHGYDRSLTVAIHDHPDNPFDTEVEVRKMKLLLESLI